MATKLDWQQCLKESYDESTSSLKTVPGSATSFAIELDATDGDSVESRPMAIDTTVLMAAVAASSNLDTAGVNILKYKGYYVSVAWSGLTGTLDGSLKLQASADDSTYHDISGASVTLSSASGSQDFNINDAYYKYFRISYTANGVTGGTITSKYVVKG